MGPIERGEPDAVENDGCVASHVKQGKIQLHSIDVATMQRSETVTPFTRTNRTTFVRLSHVSIEFLVSEYVQSDAFSRHF
jgi:hypothetical protein